MRAGHCLVPQGQLRLSSMVLSYTPSLSLMRRARSASSSELS